MLIHVLRLHSVKHVHKIVLLLVIDINVPVVRWEITRNFRRFDNEIIVQVVFSEHVEQPISCLH